MSGDYTPSKREPSSFRDQSAYVFSREGRIYRAVDQVCHDILQDLAKDGMLDRLLKDGLIVNTSMVEDETQLTLLHEEHPAFQHFLEHEVVSPITYPYEWTISMLSMAARLTLDLQIRLLGCGLSLKDASAYNVQFRADQPVFIDISSIERPIRLDIWTALGQFGQMFTFPMLLTCYQGWDLRSYFIANLGGRSVGQVIQSLGRLERWLPRYLLDISLPALLHGRAKREFSDGDANPLQKPNSNAGPQLVNLRRLRRKIERLAAAYRPHSNWAQYCPSVSYADQAELAKKNLVGEFLLRYTPPSVLDVGCNTGDYSYLAAQAGAQVIAIDADHDAVELLYRRLQNEPSTITPLVVDLGNPSPAIGFLNEERRSFLNRVEVECVLALGLIHHLRISGNLPLEMIRDLFCRLSRRLLVLEVVPRNDPMSRQLASMRTDSYEDLSLEHARTVFQQRFEILREEKLPDSVRTLLFLEKRP